MKLISLLFSLLLIVGFNVTLSAQQNRISGNITDDKGEALAGVSVVVKGSRIGTNSDQQGQFSLSKAKNQNILVFSLLGYITKEMEVGENMRVTLQEDTRLLNEVVVTTQKRSQSNIEVPAAVNALSGESLQP